MTHKNDFNSTHTFTAGVANQNINAILENDITISGEWTPIGVYSNTTTQAKPYSGTFDGDGKTVMFQDSTISAQYAGLFGNVSGSVKNLVVVGSVSSTAESPLSVAGISAVLNGGTIEYCVNKATVLNISMTGTGGIVGYVASDGGTVTGCVNMGNITSEQSTVGGIVGATASTSTLNISKCINVGEVFGTSNISGVLGNSASSSITISNCMNLGKISANNSSGVAYASGITTPSAAYTVSFSINVGEVTASGTSTLSLYGGISSVTSYLSNYSNNYYDNSVNSNVVDSSVNGITGKSTDELIGTSVLDGISSENWSFAENRYPLPDLENSLPTGSDASGQTIWDQIVDAATPNI